MKKNSKIFLFILLIVMPTFVFAASKRNYDVSKNAVGNYLNSNNYINSWEKYLKDPVNLGEDLIINEDEYNATKNSRGVSYLLDEKACWTRTDGDIGKKVITINGGTEDKDTASFYYVRASEFILPKTKVKGSGSYNNPWTFAPVYKVSIETTKEGEIASDGTSVVYVTKESDAFLGPAVAKSGYMYITNDCGATYYDDYNVETTEQNKYQVKIKLVKKETNCKLIFGTGKFKITLNGANPLEIFLKYKDNYYTNANYNVPITKIQSVQQREGYTFKGYYYNNFQVIDENLNVKRESADKIHENVTLNPKYKIGDLTEDITITGGVTRVNNYQAVTLTCSKVTEYDDDTQIYYQFGIKNADNTIEWLDAESTNNTYTITKNAFLGSKNYVCRAYATDGENNTKKKTSSTTATVTLVHARIDLDATTNGGELSGNKVIYVSYKGTNKYKNRTNNTTAVLPTVSKTGYTPDGWYTSASAGSKVIDSVGVIQSNVSGWTNSSGQFILSNASNTEGTHKLFAHFTPNPLTFDNKTITSTYSTAKTTKSITSATNGTGTYTYAITGGNTNSYFSLSGTTLTIKANTPANTSGYQISITATDSNSGSKKTATYTIKINPAALSAAVTVSGTTTWGQTLKANPSCTTPSSGCEFNTYQWKADGTNINGATKSTYVIPKEMVGKKISVSVKANATNYVSSTVTSAKTAEIAKQDLTVVVTPYSGTYDGDTHYSKIKVTSKYWDGKKILSGDAPSTVDTIVTSSGEINKNYSLKSGYKNAGSRPLYYDVVGGKYYKDKSGATNITINQATCNPPTGVTIGTDGKVTWTESSNASSYQISIDNSTFTTASSGVNYKSKIIEASGNRTVYVRSVCNSTNYKTPSTNATATIAVYKVTLKKGTGIASVSGAGNYIKGSSVSINSTLSRGYKWSKWIYTSSSSQVSTTQNYSNTISRDWDLTAQATAMTYTIIFDANGGSGAPGNQTVTYGQEFTLSSQKPTRSGYAFVTWKDSTQGTWVSGKKYTWTWINGEYGIKDNTVTIKATWQAAEIVKTGSVKIGDGNVDWPKANGSGRTKYKYDVFIDYTLTKKTDGKIYATNTKINAKVINPNGGYFDINDSYIRYKTCFIGGSISVGNKSNSWEGKTINCAYDGWWVLDNNTEVGSGSSITINATAGNDYYRGYPNSWNNGGSTTVNFN